MRKLRLTLWLTVVMMAGFSLALLVSPDLRERLIGTPAGPARADIGGAFTLVDETGRTVTQDDFLGTPTAYFFGFTHCPDVCPTTLFEVSQWLEALGPDADRMDAVFVTVDPERDTAEILRNYLSSFDEQITGLTGTPEDVAAMTRTWRVYVNKVPAEDGSDNYAVDHTASIYLMDSRGDFFGTIAYGEPAENAIGKLRRLIEEG